MCGLPQEAPEQEVFIPAPVSVQLVTLVALQEIEALLPAGTREGLALIESAGLITVTNTDLEQPAAHCRLYVVVVFGLTECDPEPAIPLVKLLEALED